MTAKNKSKRIFIDDKTEYAELKKQVAEIFAALQTVKNPPFDVPERFSLNGADKTRPAIFVAPATETDRFAAVAGKVSAIRHIKLLNLNAPATDASFFTKHKYYVGETGKEEILYHLAVKMKALLGKGFKETDRAYAELKTDHDLVARADGGRKFLRSNFLDRSIYDYVTLRTKDGAENHHILSKAAKNGDPASITVLFWDLDDWRTERSDDKWNAFFADPSNYRRIGGGNFFLIG